MRNKLRDWFVQLFWNYAAIEMECIGTIHIGRLLWKYLFEQTCQWLKREEKSKGWER